MMTLRPRANVGSAGTMWEQCQGVRIATRASPRRCGPPFPPPTPKSQMWDRSGGWGRRAGGGAAGRPPAPRKFPRLVGPPCTWAGRAAVAGAVARRVPRGRLGGGLGNSQVEDAALVQAAVVVVQVAGVGAFVCGLQRVDAQREVAAREGVRPDCHAVAQEGRPVGAALTRRVQVEQAVGAVVWHPGRLPVPVHHLLRLLQVPVGPHVRAVHAGQQRGRAALHYQHLLLARPVRAGGLGWGSKSVKDPGPGEGRPGGRGGCAGEGRHTHRCR